MNHGCHILQHLGSASGASQLILQGFQAFAGNITQYGVARANSELLKGFRQKQESKRERQRRNSLTAGQNPKRPKMTQANSLRSDCSYLDQAANKLTNLPNTALGLDFGLVAPAGHLQRPRGR